MRLNELLEDDGTQMQGPTNLDITGMTADSRSVEPGYLFAALPGSVLDGRAYIPEAVERGAVAILAPEGTSIHDNAVHLFTDANPRRRFAQLAARYHVEQPETSVAVTGTNGKTSVAQFLHQIWKSAGHDAATLGTLGVTSGRLSKSGNLTTPDPVSLHSLLAELSGQGVDHLVMEASSHGLDQFRIDGVKIRAAAFTNLSRDHLDYHGTMEAYLAAKVRLFSDVLVSGGVAVINADVPECDAILSVCEKRGHRVLTYGRNGDALSLLNSKAAANGRQIELRLQGKTEEFTLPLAGHFQTMNALCAAGLALATGVESNQIVDTLTNLDAVPGRLELVGTRANGAALYVDYAHTPDALTTALEALRPHTTGQLIVVFGAGGDRDQGKRELMGQAAAAADVIYITDDNPRSENPASIRADILKGVSLAVELGDRAEAIETAVAQLNSGDVLLVAGKGHETGQIIGDTVLPFDDRDVSRAALKRAGDPS